MRREAIGRDGGAFAGIGGDGDGRPGRRRWRGRHDATGEVWRQRRRPCEEETMEKFGCGCDTEIV